MLAPPGIFAGSPAAMRMLLGMLRGSVVYVPLLTTLLTHMY